MGAWGRSTGRPGPRRMELAILATGDEALEFWFGRPGDADYGRYRDIWWAKDAAFDETVRSRFLGLYERAAQGALAAWRSQARSCLALVLVLDQFPRNMFRGDARAYASDTQARATARHAVAMGFDRGMTVVERGFFYTPFEHGETLADQCEAVRLFEALPEHEGKAETLRFVLRHLEIIERFGRFPHRNAVLGRATTAQEAAFLKEPDSAV